MFPFFDRTSINMYDAYGMYGGMAPYGSLTLTETSPAQTFEEPVGLDEAQSYLKIPVSTEDGDLLALISAARFQAEILQGRDLVRKQWDLHRDYWPPSNHIDLRSPLVSVDLVQYRDSAGNYTQLAEDMGYVVDTSKQPGAIVPMWNQFWPDYIPWPSSSLLIRHTSGYASDAAWWANAGALVKVGIRKLVALYFYKRVPFSDALLADPVLMDCLSAGGLRRAK